MNRHSRTRLLQEIEAYLAFYALVRAGARAAEEEGQARGSRPSS